VTDAARADLKKEMTKKNVRKTIVDGVLSKLVSGGGVNGGSNPQSEGSENGDAPSVAGVKSKGYVPPSLALQAQRPTVDTVAGPSGTSNAKDVSRPASRAAMAEPPNSSDNAEIKPVYVGFSSLPFFRRLASLSRNRLHQDVIWRLSLLQCLNRLR
jgi:CLIP-associating protein 1/2